jgi:hypothetical protein
MPFATTARVHTSTDAAACGKQKNWLATAPKPHFLHTTTTDTYHHIGLFSCMLQRTSQCILSSPAFTISPMSCFAGQHSHLIHTCYVQKIDCLPAIHKSSQGEVHVLYGSSALPAPNSDDRLSPPDTCSQDVRSYRSGSLI